MSRFARRPTLRQAVTISIYSRFATRRISDRGWSTAAEIGYDGGTPCPQLCMIDAMLPDHEIEIRVRYYETDAQGFVHHANYFLYFELARVEQLLALGYDYAQLEHDGVLLVVNKIACKYHSRASSATRCDCKFARSARAGHASTTNTASSAGHELLAEAESTLACIDREGRVQRLPDFLMMEVG